MADYKSREELEHQAMDAVAQQKAEEDKEHYVERPKAHRILAWILICAVIVGVILYYFWIAKAGKL
ncbi:MAG: hypothetical protein II437_06715 [Oscillospiraceae bacterium]|jgi:hypothetical protein|nr:hypothetical protein [Oscillospiraceae bacterium]